MSPGKVELHILHSHTQFLCESYYCGIVIYIFSIYQKSKIFSLLKKFLLSSLHLNHIYFLVHLQTQYKKQIGLFIILKSR